MTTCRDPLVWSVLLLLVLHAVWTRRRRASWEGYEETDMEPEESIDGLDMVTVDRLGEVHLVRTDVLLDRLAAMRSDASEELDAAKNRIMGRVQLRNPPACNRGIFHGHDRGPHSRHCHSGRAGQRAPHDCQSVTGCRGTDFPLCYIDPDGATHERHVGHRYFCARINTATTGTFE